jgi:ubiquinone/menaquinone biosynthesis C-methylase UbiE
MEQYQQDLDFRQKGPIHYRIESDGKLRRYQPWLGDSVAFLYDLIMDKSVFPKKFGADRQKHLAILSELLSGIHHKQVLELGTGSGSAVEFLPEDNAYVGSDISAGLLKKAHRRFVRAGFQDPAFYLISGDDLPFRAESFDLCLCILSLNFIGNVAEVFRQVYQTLRPGGEFVVCIPVPGRNKLGTTIRGELHSEAALEQISQEVGFSFQPVERENGALLYFRAIK